MALKDPVGMGEIAHRAGVTVNAVKQWRKRHPDFPPPKVTLAVGPLWEWSHVEKWLAGRA